MNDHLKQNFQQIKISDIQQNRSGTFTIFARDVNSFNCLLNDLTSTLTTNGQAGATIYIPRSIQRIQDTERVAFVKRVDLEITTTRIEDALSESGFDAESVQRLSNKETNNPTQTIKITFRDTHNRNCFVRTGLQIDSMHFVSEKASQNFSPIQCYSYLQFGHFAKYCKAQQQRCARCGDNHQTNRCQNADQKPKCCNCQGEHAATSKECPVYKEREKRAKEIIIRYTCPTKPKTTSTLLDIDSTEEFPALRSRDLDRTDGLLADWLTATVKKLTEMMERMVEETTNRLIKSFTDKINELTKNLEIKINRLSKTIPQTDPEQKQAENLGVDITNDKPTQPVTTNKVTQQRKKKKNKKDPPEAPPQISTDGKEQRSGSTSKRNRSANTSTESIANTPNDPKAGNIENDN